MPARTEAQRLLLGLLRDDGWPSDPLAASRWPEVLRLADLHGVTPLLHEQQLLLPADARDRLPAPLRKDLTAARVAELRRELKRQRAQALALEVLAGPGEAQAIPTLLLKGAASARTLYAAPELRPRSDLDLLVAPLDRHEALTRLFARGFTRDPKTLGTREDEPGWHEQTLIEPATGEPLDLHFALSQASRHRLDAKRLFAAAVREPALGAAARLLPVEEAALVCVHALVIHELSVPLVAICDLVRLFAKAELTQLARLAREVRLARGLWLGAQLVLSLGPERGGPFSLAGAPVEPERLSAMAARLSLSPAVRLLLGGAARAYDLERQQSPRLRQLWRKALFIDRPRDAARFALGHGLQTLRRRAARPLP